MRNPLRRRGRPTPTADLLRAQFVPIPGWSVRVEPGGARVVVDFPHDAGGLDFDPDDWDWVSPAQSPNALTSQYLNSLTYLPLIGEQDPQAAQAVLSAYDRFARSKGFHGRVRKRSSWALATAARLQAVAVALAEETLPPGALASSVVAADVDWVLDEQHIPLTNHGFLVLEAALSMARVMTDHGDPRARDLRAAVRAGLPRVLDKVFGEDGWSDENGAQPSYQWLAMIDRLLTTHEDALRSLNLRDPLRRTRAAVRHSTSAQTFPDGTLIPRGDTFPVATDLRPPPGTHHSARTGVWVHHGPHLSVLAVSGCADLGRKQRDDTAIVLRYRGQDVFLDAGHAGVVKGDRRVYALRRAWGHSCLTSEALDDPSPEEFADLRDHGWARLDPDAPTEGAVAAVDLGRGRDGLFEVRRRLQVHDEALQVIDTWSAPEDWRPAVRFLVPTDLAVDVRDARHLVLTGGGIEATLRFSVDVEVEIVTGEQEEPHRGWRGVGEGRFEPCHSLEVRPVIPGDGLSTEVALRAG